MTSKENARIAEKREELVKSCDNCGLYDDCRNSLGTWSCHDESAWVPKEDQPAEEPPRFSGKSDITLPIDSDEWQKDRPAEEKLCQLIDDDLASIARYFEARKLEEASGAAADLAKRLEEQLS